MKTGANEESSRSHAIFQIKISTTIPAKDKTKLPKKTKGHITIVDLAGSERLKESNTEGDTLRETKAINSSLNALKDVIVSMSRKEAHVPFRNSRLTKFLQDFLGKDCKTLFIINVSPFSGHYQQTVGSLNFGKELKKVSQPGGLKPKIANGEMSSQKKKSVGPSSLSSQTHNLGGSGAKRIANPAHDKMVKRFLDNKPSNIANTKNTVNSSMRPKMDLEPLASSSSVNQAVLPSQKLGISKFKQQPAWNNTSNSRISEGNEDSILPDDDDEDMKVSSMNLLSSPSFR